MSFLPVAMVAMQAGSQIMGGIAANKQAKASARANKENARLSLLQGEMDSADIAMEARDQVGQMLAASGGDGIAFTGSIADVVAQATRNRDADIAALIRQASDEAKGYRTQARADRRAGRSALIGGLFSAASTVLSHVSNRSTAAKAETIRATPRMRVGSSG